MIDLCNIFGLCLLIYLLVCLFNFLNVDCILQSIFYFGYQEIYCEVSCLFGDWVIVIKGEGGEIEVNLDVVVYLYGCDQGEVWDEEWLVLLMYWYMKLEQFDLGFFWVVWDGCEGDVYGYLVVFFSMVLVLWVFGKNCEEVFKEVVYYWVI